MASTNTPRQHAVVRNPNSSIYTYDRVKAIRVADDKGNPSIKLLNADNPREMFCEFTLKTERVEPKIEEKYFEIPKIDRDK